MPGSIEWTGRRFHQKQGSLMSTTAPPNIPKYAIYSKHFTVNLAIFKPDFTTDLRHKCIVRIMYLKIFVSKHPMDMLLQR